MYFAEVHQVSEQDMEIKLCTYGAYSTLINS